MIVSVNWLKKFTDIDVSIDELVALIGSRLVEVEEVIDLGARYKDIVVAKVVRVMDHDDAERLHVCMIDDGGKTEGVQRSEEGYVQVVCGAPNVREGIMVAWLPPGSTVPSTIELAEPLVLTSRELRGVISNGMLASAKELAVGENHEGIVELNSELKPGDSFAEAMELDDYLLDIENKSLTHRPDCFGLIGFAREVAAIQGKPFKSPDWYLALEPVLDDKQIVEGIREPKVTIDDPDLCPRYEAVVVANVDPRIPSPLIIQSYLKRVGIRPINEVVDITNYLMVVSGHPTHAFDYDAFVKIGGTDELLISVRAGKKNEKLALLDGRTIELTHEDIVICSNDKPVALAGAMGGAETEVTEDTKHVLLESATFNLYNLRGTTMRHGISSDAATRFTKGQAAAQTAPVLASAVRMLCDIAGGVRASNVIDKYPGKTEPATVNVSVEQTNNLLGTSLTDDDIKATLQNAEFQVAPRIPNSEFRIPNLAVQVPYWRQDIHIPEDVIEEIGRIRGFDSVNPVLPKRPYVAVHPEPFEQFRSKIRQTLSRAGGNEVLTYSFVHGDLLKKVGQDPTKAFKIVNALSPDLQHYRLSLTPSLLANVHPNLKQGYGEFALFELNKVHQKGLKDPNEPEVPLEMPRLGLVMAANDKLAKNRYDGSPFYEAKKFLEYLANTLGIAFEYVSLTDYKDLEEQLAAPFESKRSAAVLVGENPVGVIGEYKNSVRQNLKLPAFTAGFELALGALFEEYNKVESSYRPLSRYPGTEQDICLRVDEETTYQQIVNVASDVLQKTDLDWNIEPVDIYQREHDKHKQITIRVGLINHLQTITTDHANKVIAGIVTAANQQLNAEQI